MYYDLNPPSTAHWAYRLFHLKQDPDTRQPIADPDRYAFHRLNPRDNAANLSEEYFAELEALSGRMRKRFLLGEYGEAAPGALWTEELLDGCRVTERPDMQRIIIGVDPSGASDDDPDADEIGILVVGLGVDGKAYVLEDCTVRTGPAGWARIVATAFDRHGADRVVAERNYGGDMVLATLRTAAPRMPVSLVTASRGKAVRAEPIAALYEQGRVCHIGRFGRLEDELCAMTTSGYVGSGSPNRADALVWALTELFPRVTKPQIIAKPAPPRMVHTSRTAWMA
jgi:phage terminase large subunit-like protein